MPDSQRIDDLLVSGVAAALLLSGIAPYDRLTWLMEVSWVILGILLYVIHFRKAGMTRLLLVLLAVLSLVLIVGGHYTYERVPPGYWVRDWLGLVRNNYDRLGHVMQGVAPAILFREMLLRTGTARRTPLLWVVVVMMCMGFSACFELIEWLACVTMGVRADAFLGSQGDVWDAQWDMFCCLLGSTGSLAVFSRLHDRQLAERGP